MRKKAKLKIINSLEINKPCTNENFDNNSVENKSGWFCNECNKDVHDLSKYNQQEILDLISKTNGHFCALIKRRNDGSIITKEPPASYHSGLLAAGVMLAAGISSNDVAFADEKKVVQQPSDDFEMGEISIEHQKEQKPEPVTITATPNETPTPPPIKGEIYIPQEVILPDNNKVNKQPFTRGRVSVIPQQNKDKNNNTKDEVHGPTNHERGFVGPDKIIKK